MRIAVYGAGSIGCYFGGRLAAGGADVHLIARGDHLLALKERGLQIRSSAGDLETGLPASSDPVDVGPCDVVLFCVKSTDTEYAAARLAPLLGPDTAVISLQNGVTNEERIAGSVAPEHVVGGVAYIMATIAEPGIIQHFGTVARIVFGELDGRRSKRLEALLETCRHAGLDAALSEQIHVQLWTKMAFICALAGLTAATRLCVGELRASPAAVEMFERICFEVVAVAAARGVELAADLPDRHRQTLMGMSEDWYSSLYYDLELGKPLELESLHGAILRLAREHDLQVPMTAAIYALLEPWMIRNSIASKSR